MSGDDSDATKGGLTAKVGAIAALITAIASLLTVLSAMGVFSQSATPAPEQRPAQPHVEQQLQALPTRTFFAAAVPTVTQPPPPPPTRVVVAPPTLAPVVVTVTGGWSGTMFQRRPDGAIQTFGYSLSLTQAGSNVDGTSIVAVPLSFGGYSGSIQVRGAITGSNVRLDDLRVLTTNSPPGWFWCQKTMYLGYNSSTDNEISGNWTSPDLNCGGGTVSLTRRS